MSDEEKAEEYASKKCANCIRYYCKKQNKKKIGSIDCCNEYLFQRKHFLAGLAEGKPKWHDLRENPNDLPKGDEDCLCLVSECYFIGHYAKEDKEWHFDEFISSDVIAWYEFPKFEE